MGGVQGQHVLVRMKDKNYKIREPLKKDIVDLSGKRRRHMSGIGSRDQMSLLRSIGDVGVHIRRKLRSLATKIKENPERFFNYVETQHGSLGEKVLTEQKYLCVEPQKMDEDLNYYF